VYRTDPVLWDPKNPVYYNKFSKNEPWEELAKAMGTSSEDSKKKISLLSSLRTERTKIRKSHGTGRGMYILL
jgi:hypothetical protein